MSYIEVVEDMGASFHAPLQAVVDERLEDVIGFSPGDVTGGDIQFVEMGGIRNEPVSLRLSPGEAAAFTVDEDSESFSIITWIASSGGAGTAWSLDFSNRTIHLDVDVDEYMVPTLHIDDTPYTGPELDPTYWWGLLIRFNLGYIDWTPIQGSPVDMPRGVPGYYELNGGRIEHRVSNLILNGDAELGNTDGWLALRAGSSVSGNAAYEGEYGVALRQGSASPGQWCIRLANIADASPGDGVMASLDYRTAIAGGPEYMTLQVTFTAGATTLGTITHELSDLSGSWQRIYLNGTVPEGTLRVVANVVTGSGGHGVDIDNMMLELSDQQNPFALSSMSMTGLDIIWGGTVDGDAVLASRDSDVTGQAGWRLSIIDGKLHLFMETSSSEITFDEDLLETDGELLVRAVHIQDESRVELYQSLDGTSWQLLGHSSSLPYGSLATGPLNKLVIGGSSTSPGGMTGTVTRFELRNGPDATLVASLPPSGPGDLWDLVDTDYTPPTGHLYTQHLTYIPELIFSVEDISNMATIGALTARVTEPSGPTFSAGAVSAVVTDWQVIGVD